MLYSTYLGGTNIDLADAVAVDSIGNAYLVGDTSSTDFPTRDAFQTINVGGANDLFITKIDTNASGANSLVFSTYYGASNFDEAGSGVAIDSEGNIYATGFAFRISFAGIIHTGKTSTVPGDDSQSDPFILKISNTSSNVIRFGSERLSVSEAAGSFEVTVVREGDSSAAANVDFATLNGLAQRGSDYTPTNGTLQFAPGETAKTFSVLITDDTTPELNESLFVILRENVEGVALAAPSVAQLTILDNDPATFRTRGYFAYKFYEVGFDRRPTYAEFVPDMAQVGGAQSPESEVISKAAYTDAFVQRQEFQNRYNALSNSAYVDALETNAEVTLTNKAALVEALNTSQKTRAQVLREIVELQSVTDKFFIRAFVAMQYFGYLRRDPDTIGYDNWVTTLTADPSNFRHMIFGFIYSTEYRQRFGP